MLPNPHHQEASRRGHTESPCTRCLMCNPKSGWEPCPHPCTLQASWRNWTGRCTIRSCTSCCRKHPHHWTTCTQVSLLPWRSELPSCRPHHSSAGTSHLPYRIFQSLSIFSFSFPPFSFDRESFSSIQPPGKSWWICRGVVAVRFCFPALFLS